MPQIKMPDGQLVEFPYDMSSEEIRGFISSKYPEAKKEALDIGQGDTGKRRFIQQPLQGATLGFSDEVTGAIGGLLAKGYDEVGALFGKERLLEGESVFDLVNAGIDKARLDVDKQVEKRPWESLGLQSAGGVLGGAAGAGTKVGQAVGVNVGRSGDVGRVAKTLGIGAGVGATAGFGAAEGLPEERLNEAATGAAVGGVLAGAIPAVGSIFRVGKNAITGRQADKIALDNIKSIVSDDVIGKKLSSRKLGDLRSELKDPESPLSIADLGGSEAKGLLRAVAKVDGAQDYVEDFLTERSEAASKRISSVLSKKVSNVDNYFQNLEDLAKARSTLAQKNYENAYKKGATLKKSKRLNTLLKDSRIESAINEAKSQYGVRVEAPRNSLETVDGVKKVLDDRAANAYRDGRSQLAKAYTALKQDLVAEVDSQVPEYKDARNIFSGFKALEDSQELGLKFTRLDPQEIINLRKGMTAGEHDAFLIGVRKSLQDAVSRTSDTADPAKKIFGNELIRSKIEAAFPDNGGFKQFAKRMRQEIEAAKTFQRVLGGSRTDFNIAEDTQAIVEFGKRARETGVTSAMIDSMIIAVKNRAAGINESNARKVAEIMLDKKKGVEALDRIIKAQNSTQSRAINTIRPLIEAKNTGVIAPAGIAAGQKGAE